MKVGQWEELNSAARRLRVEGGHLYQCCVLSQVDLKLGPIPPGTKLWSEPVFVPDLPDKTARMA